MPKVMLAEDHSITASGLMALLQTLPELSVLGPIGDGADVVDAVNAEQPDLLILDLALPGMSGLEILQALKAQAKAPRVLVFSGQSSAHSFHQARSAGADGLLSKSDPPQAILAAVQAMLNGHVPHLSPEVQKLLHPNVFQALTRREQQILALVAEGKSSGAIGADLAISDKTVKKHRENLMRKLGVTSAVDATRIAIQAGLVKAD